jgi:hypothetical protein
MSRAHGNLAALLTSMLALLLHAYWFLLLAYIVELLLGE